MATSSDSLTLEQIGKYMRDPETHMVDKDTIIVSTGYWGGEKICVKHRRRMSLYTGLCSDCEEIKRLNTVLNTFLGIYAK